MVEEEKHWQKYEILREYANKAGWNESEANSSFSPYIAWHFPALVEKVKISEDNRDWWKNTVYFTFDILLLSPVSLNSVQIVYSDSASTTYSTSVSAGAHWVEHTFSGNLAYVKTVGYKITVTALDKDGNRLSFSKSFDGLFTGALHFLADIWNSIVSEFHAAMKAVQAAVNYIVKWIVEKLKETFREVIEEIKSLLSGLIRPYGELLKAIAFKIKGERAGGDDLAGAIKRFVGEIIKFQWILIGTFTAVLAVMVAIKAVSLGMEQVVESALFMATKNLVISMLVGLLIPGLWDSITNLMNKKDMSITGIWSFIENYLGITVSYGATVISVIETIADYIESESFSWFFAGLTLAVGGFFLDAATSAVNLTGGWLQAADLAGVLISGGGLLIMILAEFLPNKKDTTESAIETVSPLLSILQWIIAIGGFAKAILDYYGDQSTGWSG